MLSIQDILRAQGLVRWTIVETTKKQSLAEHSFNVAMIARAMCKALGIPDEKVIKAALEHDLDEIHTGDIPTPTKQRMIGFGFDPDTMLSGAKNKGQDAEVDQIVAMADIIEAAWFISEYYADRHGKVVASLVHDRMVSEVRGDFHIGTAGMAVWNKLKSGAFTI